jgi:putative tryptophan/tyrosine transport system substrate-binding protein
VVKFVAALAFLTFSFHPQAQSKLAHIAYLGSGSAASDVARTEAFKQGLRDRGYTEGQNIRIEWRYPEGKAERLPTIAAELVRLNVQIIVVEGATATQAVKQNAGAIPVVMTNVSDPIGLRLVDSLAKPGGNITGLTNIAPELGAKRIELLRALLPHVTRVAVIGDPTSPAYRGQMAELAAASRPLGIHLVTMEVRKAADLERAMQSIAQARLGALVALQNPTITRLRDEIARAAAKLRLPAIYPQSEFVDAGGLVSYGPDVLDLHRQAAYFVDRILRGAKPAELPVQQPTKYELAVNLRAASQIGLAIPQAILARADKIIR